MSINRKADLIDVFSEEEFKKIPSIGDLIRRRQCDLDMTNAELAAEMNISESSVSRIISTGRRLSSRSFEALLIALKVSQEDEDLWRLAFEPWRYITRNARARGLSVEETNDLLYKYGVAPLTHYLGL